MNTRSLIILAFVALALIAYLGFSGLDDPGSKTTEARQKQLFDFRPSSINRMELNHTGGTILLTKVSAQKWLIEKPEQYPADEGRIERVLSELEFAERIARIDMDQFENQNETIKQFGLVEPRLEFSFRDDEHTFRLAVGNETARKGNYYAQIKSGAESDIVVIKSDLESLMDPEITGWRSKRIFDFDTTSVTSLSLKSDTSDVELTKVSGDWMISRPYSGATEPTAVVSFLGGLLTARVKSFAPEEAVGLAEYGLSAPQITLAVTTGERVNILSIGKQVPEQGDLYYARVSSRDAVMQVTAELVGQVKDLLPHVREKRVLTQSLSQVTGITLQHLNESISLSKSGDVWTLVRDGKVAAPEIVNQFYTALSEVKGDEFFEKSDQNRSDFNLAPPEMKLAISSPASAEGETSAVSRKMLRISPELEGFRYIDSDYIDFMVKVPAASIPIFTANRTYWLARKLDLPLADDWSALSWNAAGAKLNIGRNTEGQWPASWNGRELDLKFLERQIDLLGSIEIVSRIPVSIEDEESDLTLQIKTSAETYEVRFSRPANRQVQMQINEDPEGYVIHERDYQLLAVFPLEQGKTDNAP